MIIDLVCLRSRGERLPSAEVRARMASSPLRGELQLTADRPGWHPGQRNAPRLAGVVAPGTVQWALPPLDRAQVLKIRGRDMLIVGVEEIELDRKRRAAYPQAWWCRLVDEADGRSGVQDGAVTSASGPAGAAGPAEPFEPLPEPTVPVPA
jgi:hypothetical protein